MRPVAHSFATIALSIILAAAPASAEEWQIEMDPQLTSVSFKLKATMHTVHGTAAASGSLRLNTEDGVMAGEVAIDATTAETGNTKRDKKMHTKVLRTANNPWIVLRARHLEGDLALDGTSEVTLHGEMEILGQSHKIGIPLRIEIAGGRFTASAEFEIPYVEWGLDDPSTFVLRVAKEVQMTIEAAGTIVVVD
jgi:polyisoprenoid-binding protein YceI